MLTEIFFQQDTIPAPFASDERIFLGEGLFETLYVDDSKPCYPKQHWQRLNKAASFLAIPFTIPLELWIEKLKQFISLSKLSNGGIKIILGSGKASRGLAEQSKNSQLLFHAFHYVKNMKPLKLESATWLRDGKNPIYQLKSVNYLEAIIARRQAQSADDVLFFNVQNQATDTTIANIFIIKSNQLFTPSLSCGVLAGIIRERLLIVAKEQGIDCVETDLTKDDLLQADAAFTSNSLQGIRQIASWNHHIFTINHPLIALLEELLINDRYRYH
ncbi:MAG: aminotransferase class IV [Tatlockia sp.]|nr:aminotransferase class IV [Tatlockia sp.]